MGQTHLRDVMIIRTETKSNRGIKFCTTPHISSKLVLSHSHEKFAQICEKLKPHTKWTIEYNDTGAICDVLPLRTYTMHGQLIDIIDITHERIDKTNPTYRIILGGQTNSHRVITSDKSQFEIGRQYTIAYQFHSLRYFVVSDIVGIGNGPLITNERVGLAEIT